jgi:hypothetical protein
VDYGLIFTKEVVPGSNLVGGNSMVEMEIVSCGGLQNEGRNS